MNAQTVTQLLEELPTHLEEEYAVPDHNDVDPQRYAYVLHAVRNLRRELAAFEDRVEADLLKHARRTFVVPGLGEVKISKVTRRTGWDNAGLIRKITALALDERILDTRTGEYEPAHEAVARVLGECARPSWRLAPLRARNIPVDEYCHEEPDGYSVKIG